MTGKVYRSAQGKMVDLGALQLQNEGTRAVGNMGVNARGDRVNSQNEPIDTRNQQVSRQYQSQVSNLSREKPATSAAGVREIAKADVSAAVNLTEPVVNKQVEEPKSGLAAAISRARNKGAK